LQITDVLAPADAYILCVPTPTIDRRPDLRYVEDAAAMVASIADEGAIIVLESTVPPGSTERIFEAAFNAAGKSIDDYRIAHCPERVLPGAIVDELRGNARVIGGRTKGDAEAVRALYSTFVVGKVHTTTVLVAEFVKVLENTYRDVNIAFANEIAILSEELGLDAWEAIALANEHPRVNILSPGPGVGGHCIPVDPVFLCNANPFVTELIQSARRINERMPHLVVQRIAEMLPETLRHPKIALLGAAYKANVGDARESPCARIDALLRERGMLTAIYDPHVTAFSRPLEPTLDSALQNAEACVIITDHREFASLDPVRTAALMHGRVLVDTRHMLDVPAWRRCGFTGYVLGQGGKLHAIEAVA
jgi:UDP-N-acetyl-D-mannosaminuronic acid dehydrogenase